MYQRVAFGVLCFLLAVVVLDAGVSAGDTQANLLPDNTVSYWFLLPATDNEQTSHHGLKFKFEVSGGQLRGIWITRKWEMPVVDLQYDGATLSFRTQTYEDPDARSGLRVSPHRLVLKADGDKFLGYFMASETQPVPGSKQLKLVRTQ
jgi:hypothetical protein